MSSTGFFLAKKLKKVPVQSGNCDGFIGNRMLFGYTQQANMLLLEGASSPPSPQTIWLAEEDNVSDLFEPKISLYPRFV